MAVCRNCGRDVGRDGRMGADPLCGVCLFRTEAEARRRAGTRQVRFEDEQWTEIVARGRWLECPAAQIVRRALRAWDTAGRPNVVAQGFRRPATRGSRPVTLDVSGTPGTGLSGVEIRAVVAWALSMGHQCPPALLAEARALGEWRDEEDEE